MKASTTSIILASMIVSASAFTTSSPKSDRTNALMAVADDWGAMAPLGYWDPLGFTKDNKEYLDHLREVEIRHGRVSMLATVGWLITAAGVRLPGMDAMPFGFKAISKVPTYNSKEFVITNYYRIVFTMKLNQGFHLIGE